MVVLSPESIQRIADARRDAESELKEALSGLAESDEVTPYLPPFKAFAAALFDAEADELLRLCKTDSDFKSQRNEVARRTIEDILPDRGLATAWANMPDELRRVSIEWDVATGLLFEVKRSKTKAISQEDATPTPARPDELDVATGEAKPDITEAVSLEREEDATPARTPARPEACTFDQQYGYWERFAPECVRFSLRFPSAKATVREALSRAIHRSDAFWADQFQSRASAELRRVGGESSVSEMARNASPPDGTQPKPRKRGPRPDFDKATRVADIVARIAPDGGWRPKVDDICEALDEEQVPVPRTWRRKRKYRWWADCVERAIAIKAIEYRLKIAKRRAKRRRETLG
jgi:hypothetical protein